MVESVCRTIHASVQKISVVNNANTMLKRVHQRKSILMVHIIAPAIIMHCDASSRAQKVLNFQPHRLLNMFVNMKKEFSNHPSLHGVITVSLVLI